MFKKILAALRKEVKPDPTPYADLHERFDAINARMDSALKRIASKSAPQHTPQFAHAKEGKR